MASVNDIRNSILGLQPTKEDIFNDKRTALVDGIYMKNHPIRKEMLKYVWGKYNMLPDVLTESLGRLYRAVAEVYIPPKNMKNLLDYTHDGSSIFSQRINEKYINVEGDNTISVLSNANRESFKPWRGILGNYYDTTTPNYVKEFEGLNDNSIENVKTESAVQSVKYEHYDEGDVVDENNIESSLGESRSHLLRYTADLYKAHKIKSLVSRFHTSSDKDGSGDLNSKIEFIDSAKSRVGNSHGRNLLKKGLYATENYEGGNIVNGYNNPYCRVWTHHHQYKTYANIIRSSNFVNENSDLLKRFRKNNDVFKSNTVLDENGLVRITPESRDDVKRCMFSITNLATRTNSDDIGKTMWFPPYDIKFNESVNVDWNRHTFIGRGEPIYTYTQTTRRGTLSFTLLIDHPSLINNMKGINKIDEEDYENEILRFFAGCGEIEVPNSFKYVNKDSLKKQAEPEGIEKTVPNKEGKKIKFSVYFPNNYSGHMNTLSSVDSDWVEYILYGSHIDSIGGKGYEMSEGEYNGPITDESDFDEYGFIESKGCPENLQYPYFQYRVDSDKVNECLSQENYYITESSGFNNKIEENEYIGSDMEDNAEDIEYLSFDKFVKKVKDEGIEDITEVRIYGYAPKQQSGNADETLANRRARTIAKYIVDNCSSVISDETGEEWDEGIVNITSQAVEVSSEASKDINSEESRRNRRVDVEITYECPTIEEYSASPYEEIESRGYYSDTLYLNKVGDTITQDREYDYEDEYTFFDKISENNEFAYKTIKDKIKYFSPVYHSITPEGFNERLNFLHQCTRQGNCNIKDGNDNIIAHNLAFGAPPFCELRIGDFIRTKMIIESMSINYDKSGGMQWDLNPEGAGVQPMFATISLSISIIGGQAIDGPISMLNNAVTNNYYANTGAYKDAKFKKDEKRNDK